MSYDHDRDDPNINKLVRAMKYDSDGEPVLRVSIENIEDNAGWTSPSTSMPSGFATLNNFEDDNNRGWDIQDSYLPLFGIRVKPGSETEFHLINFNITLNGGNQVVVGYQWHMNPTLRDAYSWTDLGTTGIQYVKFDDVDDSPNLITSNTEVHSKTLVGKSTSDLTDEMKQFPFTDGGIEMFLEIRRLDGGSKQDLWYDMTMAID